METQNKGERLLFFFISPFFLIKDMEGFVPLCAKMGGIAAAAFTAAAAAVEIPFCERRIYNLVIDLFMCLHRLSLDATGHV